MRKVIIGPGALLLAAVFVLSSVADADAARRWRRYHYRVAKPPPPPVLLEPKSERAQFPLPEGVVRIEFPTNLSSASYADMQAWLDLIMRRAKRSITEDKPSTSAATQ
jgi:hypothetical protein